jgi:2-polyprenyl-3-methyl-5-hydroxy-6-metoxy-1,4-benzoquinol methylase
VNPQPSDDELFQIYNEDYFLRFGYEKRNSEGYSQLKRVGCSRLLKNVENGLKLRSGALLDLGSSLGDMLLAASNCGWYVRGIEANGYAVAIAEKRICGATVQSKIEDADFVGNWDMISCLEVLEHLRRPSSVLEKAFSALRPGGGLLITTPDVGSWLAKLQGHRWIHYHRDHLWYFNRDTLTRLVGRTGFEIVQCHSARKVFSLRYIFGILALSDRNPVIRRIASAGLNIFPARILDTILPPLRHGILLLARRPG